MELKNPEKKKFTAGECRSVACKKFRRNFKSKIWTHFGFCAVDGTDKIDKEYAICKVKMKYTDNTMNMQSRLQRHHPDLVVEKRANMSQPATVNAVFEANLPFSSLRAASITKSTAGFICKDLHPYSMVEN